MASRQETITYNQVLAKISEAEQRRQRVLSNYQEARRKTGRNLLTDQMRDDYLHACRDKNTWTKVRDNLKTLGYDQ